MANINETTAWAEGIYLIATTDDVIGGADGISNKAATQLACRTGYLKQQITYIKTGEIIAGKAEKLANPRAITMTGDATGAADFDGSGDIEINITQKNSGVRAETYSRVTVDAQGRVTEGSNPSTIDGYDITGVASLSYVQQQFEPKIGYRAVQLGGGFDQLENAVKIGWSGSKLLGQVDGSAQGAFAFESWVMGLGYEQGIKDAAHLGNTGINLANEARRYADNGIWLANIAQNQADEAVKLANTAQIEANTAHARANHGVDIAYAALNRADSAQEQANHAVNLANNAQGKADHAFDVGTNALNIANHSVGVAQGAQHTANHAVNLANNAQNTANYNHLPALTRMPFAQLTAPTGWRTVNDDTTNNRMLRVVHENAAMEIGGVHDPIFNNVVPAHTHWFRTGHVSNDHTHGIGDPGHSHGVADPGHNHLLPVRARNGSGAGVSDSGDRITNTGWTEAAQSNIGIHGAHTGIWTGGISSNHTHDGSTDNGSSQTPWQPRYLNLIICQKH